MIRELIEAWSAYLPTCNLCHRLVVGDYVTHRKQCAVWLAMQRVQAANGDPGPRVEPPPVGDVDARVEAAIQAARDATPELQSLEATREALRRGHVWKL